jgi:hypothetical protein
MAGLAAAQSQSMNLVDERFQKANQYLHQNHLAPTTSPDQAFMNDYILVVGEGLPLAASKNSGQKRLTAQRAATADAYRKLAELLDGVAIVGETFVKDAELQYDLVKTAVAGFVKGAQIVMQEYNQQEETALVIMKVGLNGPRSFGALMYEKILSEPKIATAMIPEKPLYKPEPTAVPAVTDVVYDGLIIDATDYSFRPALINRIFNPKGEVLYDPSKISQKVLVEQGCGEYTNSVDKAKAALGTRGVKTPLIVKATATVSASDLQVSDADAVNIFAANQKSSFLAGAKVAFVLK